MTYCFTTFGRDTAKQDHLKACPSQSTDSFLPKAEPLSRGSALCAGADHGKRTQGPATLSTERRCRPAPASGRIHHSGQGQQPLLTMARLPDSPRSPHRSRQRGSQHSTPHLPVPRSRAHSMAAEKNPPLAALQRSGLDGTVLSPDWLAEPE